MSQRQLWPEGLAYLQFTAAVLCHVEFLFKFFEKMVKKRDCLKIINLYHQEEVCGSHQSIYAFPAEATGTL